MNIIERIADLFNEVRSWFQKIPRDIRTYATDALEVTHRLQGVLTHPVVDFTLAMIPVAWPKELRDKAIEHLDKATRHLAIVEACKQFTDTNEMIGCWVEKLKEMPEHAQKALLFKLAALLTRFRHEEESGEKLRQSLYDTYTQITYAQSK